jgi:hypothetical protein
MADDLCGAEDVWNDGERAALEAYFSARIEATRQSLPRRDVAAAIRNLCDEQRQAMRALTRRQRQTAAAFRAAQRLLNSEPELPQIKISSYENKFVA